MAAKIRILATLIVGHVLSAGCAEILGIHPAVCDEDFDPGCSSNAPSQDAEAQDAQVADTANEAGPVPPTCDGYCDTIQAACTDLPQYQTKQACVKVCNGTFGANPATSSVGDTLTCRNERALSAAEFGGDGCVEAGMTGGGTCGEACAVYCAQLSDICPEQFAALDDCAAACAEVPRTGMPFSSPAASANTLECRFYHLQLATDDSFPHCDHAVGGGPAGSQLCAANPAR